MNEKLKKLKCFSTASFAMWPFDPEKYSEKTSNQIVIIGLNPSAKIKFGENFHKKRFDQWCEEGFSKPPFKGSYMTDLIFHHEPNSSIVIKKWKQDGQFRRKNIINLEKQFKILKVQESTSILCIGKNTMELFSSISVFSKFKHIFKINHPNSYRMKNNREIFLNDLKKIGRKI